MQILRFLHFVDNESTDIDKTNKLWKIQGLLDYINKRFRTVYTSRRELSIDETMLKFKGQLKIKQYVKIKPVKWGIKLFTLAEAKTGYVVNILPYAGRRLMWGRQRRQCWMSASPTSTRDTECSWTTTTPV